MARDIIEIDEALCDGCGDCVIGCAEGAIQIVNGKAKLVREDYCDGFGDCVAVCHSGALKVIRRDAAAFDDAATRAHLQRTQGDDAVRRYLEAQQRHERGDAQPRPSRGGCPGSAARTLHPPVHIPILQGAVPHRIEDHEPGSRTIASPARIPSELGQWPVQLHLVQPGAPFFRDREMLVMSTCGPIASAEVHQRYLRGRSVVVACPKLDNTEPYTHKLAAIFQERSIPRVIVVIMEVPCCRGLSMLAAQAHAMSGRDDLVVEEHVLSLDGEVTSIRPLV